MVYNYTRPRGPIAAMYSSPGPTYALPGLVGSREHDPRSVHNKGPAWAFGTRHGKYKDDSSPGPCYMPNQNTYRDGKNTTPLFSIYGRPKDSVTFLTPGPGAYAPETASAGVHKTSPAYSFGSRHQGRATDNTPGPNIYNPDTMIGHTVRSNKKTAPTYSMIGRSKFGGFSEDLQRTPGPGSYNVTETAIYKKKSPYYSLTGRNPMPGDSTMKPGPGSHSPENINVKLRSAPSFSFGIRHSQYRGAFISEGDLEDD